MAHCFVPGCNSGYKSHRKQLKRDKKPMVSLFRCPKDPEVQKLWNYAIARQDRSLREKDSVCSLHFLPHLVLQDKLVHFPNSQFHVNRYYRKKLVKNAVPTIFPNQPAYLKNRHIPSIAPTTDKREEILTEEDLDGEKQGQVDECWTVSQKDGSVVCRKWNRKGTAIIIKEEPDLPDTFVLTCCVPYCPSTSGDDVSFHTFPKEIKFNRIWTQTIRMLDHDIGWDLKKDSVICSLHFEANHFGENDGVPLLMWNAVPSIFPPRPGGPIVRVPARRMRGKHLMYRGRGPTPSPLVSTVLNIPYKPGAEAEIDLTRVVGTKDRSVQTRTGGAAPQQMIDLHSQYQERVDVLVKRLWELQSESVRLQEKFDFVSKKDGMLL